MHLPDGILSGHVEIAGAALAVTGMAVAGRVALDRRHGDALLPVTPGRIAGVGALVFAAQMVNVPVAAGTSGHLLGAALAVALLGPAVGILTVTAAVATQALVFADGGVTSLGLNVLNLAIVPGLVAWLILRASRARSREHPSLGRLGLASAASVVAAVLAFCVHYAAGALGGAPALTVAGHMVVTHLPIAVFEGAVTVGVVALLRRQPAAHPFRLLLGAGVVTLGLAPFASTAPDGLERVGLDRGFADLARDHLLARSPVADYELSLLSNGPMAVALAGLTGVVLLGVLLMSGGRLVAVRSARTR